MINSSLPNGTFPATFTPAPTPITLLHLVLNQTSLPGERYMAFGPSVIEVAVSPILLVFLVGGLGQRRGHGTSSGRGGRMTEAIIVFPFTVPWLPGWLLPSFS